MRAHVIDDHWPNVRDAPGGRVLEVVGPGAELVVLNRDGDYLRVITPSHLGYVWSEFVQLEQGEELHELEADITRLEGLVKQ